MEQQNQRMKEDLPMQMSPSLLENFALCEPITSRGREKLRAIGLENKVSAKDFWGDLKGSGLLVEPIDGKDWKPINPSAYDLILHYPENFEEEKIKTRRKELNDCFKGEKGVTLCVIQGVVGSGKTIELHRQLYENYKSAPFQSMMNEKCSANAIVIDLERDVQWVDGKKTRYSCRNPKEPLFLFLTTALDTLYFYLYELLMHHRKALTLARKNIEEYFYRIDNIPVRKATAFEYGLVKKISSWANSTNDEVVEYWQDFFQEILDQLKTNPSQETYNENQLKEAAKEDVKFILWLLLLLSYCTYPDQKKALFVDNIEDYIAVRQIEDQLLTPGVPVANEQIQIIYECVYQVKQQMKEALSHYNRFVSKPLMQSITVGMCIRRTTRDLLVPVYIGGFDSINKNIYDVTGDMRFETIWNQKFKMLWKNKLEDVFSKDSLIYKYMSFANEIIKEGTGDSTFGIPYAQRMMKMLSRGIRRVGHNISTSLYDAFMLLNKPNSAHIINLEEFNKIINETSYGSARGMLRQALIEYYYRRQIALTHNEKDEVGKRWRSLNIGHLGDLQEGYLFDKTGKKKKWDLASKLMYNRIQYDDGYDRVGKGINDRTITCHSMLWRILLPLSRKRNTTASACIAPEYTEMPIGQLLVEIFPDKEPLFEELKQMAKVLVAASLPEREGDYSPFVIMQLEFPYDLINQAGADAFANILLALWRYAKGKELYLNRLGFDFNKNTIRICEGGDDFIYQWICSFPFYSSLYCCNFAPLFFIKSKGLIFHILNRIYNNAEIQRDFYRHEARLFADSCNYSVNIEKLPEKYLIKIGNTSYSFDHYMCKQHLDFLSLYNSFIEQCYNNMGISQFDKEEIQRAIEIVINKYKSDEWSRTVVCY